MKRLKKLSEKIYLKEILNPQEAETYGWNTDYGMRDFAISYIDGQLFEGDVHKDMLEHFIQNNDLNEDIIDYGEGFVTEQEQEDLDLPCAFASYIKGMDGQDYIAIYEQTVYGLDIYDFKDILKNKYPNAIICIDQNRYGNTDYENPYLETL